MPRAKRPKPYLLKKVQYLSKVKENATLQKMKWARQHGAEKAKFKAPLLAQGHRNGLPGFGPAFHKSSPKKLDKAVFDNFTVPKITPILSFTTARKLGPGSRGICRLSRSGKNAHSIIKKTGKTMKGKLEILLREGHLVNQPDFEILHKNYLSKAEKLKKGKAAAERAHKIFDEKLAQGRMDLLFTIEPKTAFLVAKYRKKIAKAEFELERKRLEAWLERFLKNPERTELAKYLDKKTKELRDKTEKTVAEKSDKTEKISKTPATKTTEKPMAGAASNKKPGAKKPSEKMPLVEKPAKVSKKTK